jgi:hypothetical protein
VLDNWVTVQYPDECVSRTRRDGYYLQATTDAGERWLHCQVFRYLGEAENLADRIRELGINPAAKQPDGSLVWVQGDPVYGSPLYQALGLEAQWAERERLEDAWC